MPNTATPADRTTAGRVTPDTAILWNFDDGKGSTPVTFRRRFYQDNAGNDLGTKVRLGLQLSTGENIITDPVGKATRIQLDPGAWSEAAADALTVGPADELGPVVTNAIGERVGIPAPEVREELARALGSMRPTAATVGMTPEDVQAAAHAVVATARATVPAPPSPAVEAALAKAREKHRRDEPIQPVTVEPLIERVRAERAAAAMSVVADAVAEAANATQADFVVLADNRPEFLREQAVAASAATAIREQVAAEGRAAVQQFADALAAQATSEATVTVSIEGQAEVEAVALTFQMAATFTRPGLELSVVCTNEQIPDTWLVRRQHPEAVSVDDYRNQLDRVDQFVDEEHPYWRTVGPWSLAAVRAEMVMFSRSVERVS